MSICRLRSAAGKSSDHDARNGLATELNRIGVSEKPRYGGPASDPAPVKPRGFRPTTFLRLPGKDQTEVQVASATGRASGLVAADIGGKLSFRHRRRIIDISPSARNPRIDELTGPTRVRNSSSA
jgi:hypothetical protein